MIHLHLANRTRVTGLWVAAVALSAAPASAKDTKRACTPAYVAYKEAARELKAGHVHEAREQLQACMQSTCAGLRPKCSAMNDKLLAAMPTVVFVVNDDAGNARPDVQVKVDGDLVASKLDGLPIAVEPGVHEFAFATSAGVFATRNVIVAEGQRDRLIEAAMPAANTVGQVAAPKSVATAAKKVADAPPAEKPAVESPAAREPSHDEEASEAPRTEAAPREKTTGGDWALPRSPWPYVVGAAGVAAVAAGGLLTYWGNKDNTQLQNQCAPTCSRSDADHVKAMYVASDISFGVGLAALGVTTWLFASSRSAEKPTPTPAAALSVTPTPSGAFASVSGAF